MASGMVRKMMVYLGLSDDDYVAYDAYEEGPPVAAGSARRLPEPQDAMGVVSPVRPMRPDMTADPSNSITVRPRVMPIPVQTAKVQVVAPTHFADAQEIGDRFKSAQPVIVNLQAGDRELSRRMIDFCSGVTYALGGSMDKVADQVFLLTPPHVEVSDDEKRRLSDRGLYRDLGR